MENILEEIGLTKNEAKVYLALNSLGTTSIGPIVDRSGVSNSKIYIILEKLVKKGLVSHILLNNVKHYQMGDPQRLCDFLEEKKTRIALQEQKIREIIPQLTQAQHAPPRGAELFDGFQGLRTVRERTLDILQKKDELLVLGVSRFAMSQYGPYFENYHKRRIAKGISCRYLMYEETRKFGGEKRSRWKLTKVRYLKNDTKTPARIDIYASYVDIAIDAVDPFVISIKSKEISESFRNYFEQLWKTARK